MDKVSLLNVNNAQVDVAVVRFFSLNNNNYLIYSLNEVDRQNYVKLYAVKIITDANGIMSSNITDENEWLAVKEMIKIIIKGNKEGNLNVTDLDYQQIENVRVADSRVFKLSLPLVELLQANKKVFNVAPEAPAQPNEVEMVDVVQPTMPNVAAEPQTVVPPIPTPVVEPVAPQPVAPMPAPVPEPQSIEQPGVNQEPEVDYQAMYLAEKENSMKLSQEVEMLKNKLNAIKEML